MKRCEGRWKIVEFQLRRNSFKSEMMKIALQYASNFWKKLGLLSHKFGKESVFIPIQKKTMQNAQTAELHSSHAKQAILQIIFSNMWTKKNWARCLSLVLRQNRDPCNIHWIMERQRDSGKHLFLLLLCQSRHDCVDHNVENSENGNADHWPTLELKKICMQTAWNNWFQIRKGYQVI